MSLRLSPTRVIPELVIDLGDGRELKVRNALVQSVGFSPMTRGGSRFSVVAEFAVDPADSTNQPSSERLMEDLIVQAFTVPEAFRTETVRGLADTILEGPRLDLMPILADALEEAGCDTPHILRALRGYADGPQKGVFARCHTLVLESCRATP